MKKQNKQIIKPDGFKKIAVLEWDDKLVRVNFGQQHIDMVFFVNMLNHLVKSYVKRYGLILDNDEKPKQSKTR
mgnify:CR=1 FL=1